jgi:carboxypeptidase C (cathepsin A)
MFAHMLYVDQPLNVGFSYSGNRTGQQVTNAREGASHLLNFLYNFYRQWPSLVKSPLYVFGESYGGHYVPPFARAVASNFTFSSRGVVLKGIGLGDGWVDPVNQINFYDSLLYSVGIVSNKFRDVCTWVQAQGLINVYRRDFANVANS